MLLLRTPPPTSLAQASQKQVKYLYEWANEWANDFSGGMSRNIPGDPSLPLTGVCDELPIAMRMQRETREFMTLPEKERATLGLLPLFLLAGPCGRCLENDTVSLFAQRTKLGSGRYPGSWSGRAYLSHWLDRRYTGESFCGTLGLWWQS